MKITEKNNTDFAMIHERVMLHEVTKGMTLLISKTTTDFMNQRSTVKVTF